MFKKGRPEAEKIMIKKTIKIPLFWKIYIIVVTIVLIGFVVLWSILWTALKKYEQSRPEYAMDKIKRSQTSITASSRLI